MTSDPKFTNDSGASAELIESVDAYIHDFIRGTELMPERPNSRE